MSFPRLTASVFVTHKDSVENIGPIDFTEDVLRKDSYHKNILDMWLSREKVPLVMDFVAIPAGIGLQAMQQKVTISIPDFVPNLQNFVDQVGDRENRMRLYKHLGQIDNESRRIDRLTQIFHTVKSCKWSQSATSESAYIGAELSDDFFYDYESIKDHYFSGLDANGEETFSPPFCFVAREKPWDTASLLEDIKERFEEEGRLSDRDVDSCLESSLDSHFENAYDHLVDVDELFSIVSDWQDAVLDGGDFDLEDEFSQWAEKQSIMSYEHDFKVAVPLDTKIDRNDAMLWVEDQIKKSKERAIELENKNPIENTAGMPMMM